MYCFFYYILISFVDFCMRVVIFDSVLWMVIMKKNEYYFFIVEFIKDFEEEIGWWRVIYEGGGKVVLGEGEDGVVFVFGDVVDMDVDVDV